MLHDLKVMLHETTCNTDFSCNAFVPFLWRLHGYNFRATIALVYSEYATRKPPACFNEQSEPVLRAKLPMDMLCTLKIRHIRLRVFESQSKTRYALPLQKIVSDAILLYTILFATDFSGNNVARQIGVASWPFTTY